MGAMEKQAASREEAERLICLLPLLSCLLPHLNGSMGSLSREMENDLLQIIQRNNYTMVSLLSFVLLPSRLGHHGTDIQSPLASPGIQSNQQIT
jgi:hypothetical protein